MKELKQKYEEQNQNNVQLEQNNKDIKQELRALIENLKQFNPGNIRL